MNDITLPSGRFVLRIDPRLHAALREAAAEAGVSLNEYCARRLAAPATELDGASREAVERAMELVGGGLIGVVVFGSWAREEAAEGSDVDLLMIVDPAVPVERDLYRLWDESPVRWGTRVVEPHFVHLPGPGDRVSGLWAEAAVDGVVLFERGLRVSRWLAAVRRRIAEGRLVRHRAHGQPYWVEAA